MGGYLWGEHWTVNYTNTKSFTKTFFLIRWPSNFGIFDIS